MRSRIFYKLLITLLLSFSLIVAVMLFIINSSFQLGFLDYLHQKEIRQTENLKPFLIQHYQQHNSWALMQHNHDLWREALTSANINTPPSKRGGPHRPPPQGRPPIERVSDPLEMRISLHDVNKALVFGSHKKDFHGKWIALEVQKELIGWLKLRPTELAGDQLASSFLEQQQKSFFFIAAAVLLLSIIVAALWARLLLRPVNRVIEAVDQLSSGNYDTRVDLIGNDELARLALNFNRMAKTLQQNESLRSQWLADISHELRTPVSVIKGEIEALQDGLRQPTKERITSIEEEVTSLIQIIEDLHQLALADNDALEMQFTECDLYSLINHQVQLFQPRMLNKNLALSLVPKPQGNCLINADQRRMTQLLSNLLENSLRYTDAGGKVKVTLLNSTTHLNLIVSDAVPGVPTEDLEKIFARLYCVDKSRSRIAGGSGLGLAICRSIVDAHEGAIFAKIAEEGGLHIEVKLPLSQI